MLSQVEGEEGPSGLSEVEGLKERIRRLTLEREQLQLQRREDSESSSAKSALQRMVTLPTRTPARAVQLAGGRCAGRPWQSRGRHTTRRHLGSGGVLVRGRVGVGCCGDIGNSAGSDPLTGVDGSPDPIQETFEQSSFACVGVVVLWCCSAQRTNGVQPCPAGPVRRRRGRGMRRGSDPRRLAVGVSRTLLHFAPFRQGDVCGMAAGPICRLWSRRGCWWDQPTPGLGRKQGEGRSAERRRPPGRWMRKDGGGALMEGRLGEEDGDPPGVVEQAWTTCSSRRGGGGAPMGGRPGEEDGDPPGIVEQAWTTCSSMTSPAGTAGFQSGGECGGTIPAASLCGLINQWREPIDPPHLAPPEGEGGASAIRARAAGARQASAASCCVSARLVGVCGTPETTHVPCTRIWRWKSPTLRRR